ncbi:hypothetical protein TTHERM_000237681 (macronuclear) [Tetrahymena thermophila SB210]|uniref:Uncharacterized protein n=1 Tax=Tetrahymena thermophila (strain SB210) TaxID=312017 RepID=W7X5Y2_TETTS|nr:hypothetical protein TTHERM_000237681 [Tetrahymena thermophila SB210]EWS71773.1 hypothetical protein TTHERM_000237681 [Tetrahymena thermophila SB210]|eukprot:XP_012655660.1 hypothetical protein TTHERM_000237681 [Tetrahymena thermophila SB210]
MHYLVLILVQYAKLKFFPIENQKLSNLIENLMNYTKNRIFFLRNLIYNYLLHLIRLICEKLPSSCVGLVAGLLPSKQSARVRFPDAAFFEFIIIIFKQNILTVKKKNAASGNRTRADCLEGNNPATRPTQLDACF